MDLGGRKDLGATGGPTERLPRDERDTLKQVGLQRAGRCSAGWAGMHKALLHPQRLPNARGFKPHVSAPTPATLLGTSLSRWGNLGLSFASVFSWMSAGLY